MAREPLRSVNSVVSRGYKWTSKTLWGYGVGHVGNDLCASLWFSYLLVFLEQVTKMDSVSSGLLMIIGQMTDGIATPIVGYGLDKIGLCGSKYGRRKSWHVLGTVLVSISFAFIYTPPPGHNPETNPWSSLNMVLYYTPFIMLFQIAWASVQVSHLSLIPCLTSKDSARVQLNSIRYAFTVLSNLTIFLGCFFLLRNEEENHLELVSNSNVTLPTINSTMEIPLEGNCTEGQSSEQEVNWNDAIVFKYLAFGALALGLFFSMLFHCFVHENNECCDEEEGEEEEGNIVDSRLLGSAVSMPSVYTKPAPSNIVVDKWSDWFKHAEFYYVALLYMLTRMIVNITATYIPFYLQISLNLDKKYIAVVPLVQYVTGFCVSFTMKPLSKHLGKNGTFFLGAILTITASIWGTILDEDMSYFGVYILGFLFGAGTTTVLVQSLAITAELIGENTNTSAFVYGAMSLTDKIACGAAIMLVQSMADSYMSDCMGKAFYCRLLGYGIGTIAVAAIFANLLHWKATKQDKKQTR